MHVHGPHAASRGRLLATPKDLSAGILTHSRTARVRRLLDGSSTRPDEARFVQNYSAQPATWQRQRTSWGCARRHNRRRDSATTRRGDVEKERRREGEVKRLPELPVPPTLMQAARLVGSGVASDLRRRAPFYKDDWTSIGRNKLRVAAASTFIFFASVGTLDSTAARAPCFSLTRATRFVRSLGDARARVWHPVPVRDG